ncbi:MAG: sulfoxide reductase heme-binding subunit YedZ [Gammaproteobacteria bacterium]|nr:MAG: sulfoxide reductase heme-binding subunit YedZ [Gammaproteobacteria bacterium]
MLTNRQIEWGLKPAVFLLALVPFALLAFDAFGDRLGANPVEAITLETGQWSLRFLLITLAVTPLRRFTGWNAVVRLRRMLGLFAFFYLCMHFLTFIGIDHFFAWSDIAEDVFKRPYVTVGFTSFVLLVPLAITSTNAMQRRLGGKRWKRLHQLVYVATTGGVLHFLWLVKSDTREPLIYLTLLTLLLVLRLPAAIRWRPALRAQPQAR